MNYDKPLLVPIFFAMLTLWMVGCQATFNVAATNPKTFPDHMICEQ